ncbi:hypothetical protein [Streptomyces sp. NPDC001770]
MAVPTLLGRHLSTAAATREEAVALAGAVVALAGPVAEHHPWGDPGV